MVESLRQDLELVDLQCFFPAETHHIVAISTKIRQSHTSLSSGWRKSVLLNKISCTMFTLSKASCTLSKVHSVALISPLKMLLYSFQYPPFNAKYQYFVTLGVRSVSHLHIIGSHHEFTVPARMRVRLHEGGAVTRVVEVRQTPPHPHQCSCIDSLSACVPTFHSDHRSPQT